MPVVVSYPGVYIEEIPSGVRTIVGVETSVTAFVGYTQRGPTDRAVQIFNFGDYERTFGGLHQDSDVSYAVQHYFQNGGGKAWIVRVASGAQKSGISMENDVDGGAVVVLDVEAVSEGLWGDLLRLEVDYDTSNPASLFNLRVVELVDRNGVLQPARTELHRNLSMNSFAANYAVTTVNVASDLIRIVRPLAATGAVSADGTSESGALAQADLDLLDDDHRRLAITIDGDGPHEFDIFDAGGSLTGANFAAQLGDLATRIQAQVTAIKPAFAAFTCAASGSVLVCDGPTPTDQERSSVRFTNASLRNTAAILKLGLANGGRETDAAAAMRPAQSGTTGTRIPDLDLTTLDDAADVEITVRATGFADNGPHAVSLWSTLADKPSTLEELRSHLETALGGSSRADFNQAQVKLFDFALVVVPGGNNPDARFQFGNADGGADTTATDIGLAGGTENVALDALGVGSTSQAQASPIPGDDGTPPNATELIGSRNAKTGFYRLEDVDLFNILCIPNQSDVTLLARAEAYAEERRSFMIIDLPATVDTLAEAKTWLAQNGTLRHKNAAAYFPRILAGDPLQNNRQRAIANSGAVAGLYARIDGARGVWKAPAGTEAGLRGVLALDYTLTDPENGVLNPLGLNCLRNFPAFGPVVWGARTLDGNDQKASEWKYVPVRRLALFLEESLYRGTQWVVFEPNDEPLWAQIRLNVGAFMNNLFRQGAFQGKTPRDAYLVKCDRETTTQNDINLGIVNIVVGFAPLKPAEFVIIKIQQLAGQNQT